MAILNARPLILTGWQNVVPHLPEHTASFPSVAHPGHRLCPAHILLPTHESCFAIYLGLDCPAEEVGLGEEVINITSKDISREDHMSGEPDKAIIMIVASSARDASMAPEGKGSIMILTPAYMDYKDERATVHPRENGESSRQL